MSFNSLSSPKDIGDAMLDFKNNTTPKKIKPGLRGKSAFRWFCYELMKLKILLSSIKIIYCIVNTQWELV